MADKSDERPQWDNKAQFLLTCVGFAVGLGNIWRFPYILQKNGGGAFLIPYFIMLFIEGIPLLYVELTVGQLMRAGSIGVWRKVSKYLGGIGICSMFVSFLIGVYYNTIIGWIIWYIVNSFQNPLPWQDCPLDVNMTGYTPECDLSSPSQYFWYRTTLDISSEIAIGGGIKLNTFSCLMAAWLLVLIALSKGIASSGKVVYFTATFPYLVLIIFLIRGVTLEGANVGLTYLFSADFSKLSNPSIWLTAATQIFFSLSLAFGGMIAFSSYNPRNNDCERDTLIVAATNSVTSILASAVIFAVLGFKATIESKECVLSNIETILDVQDLPQGNISVANYDQYIIDNNVGDLNLTSCAVEDFLDTSASGAGLAFIVIADAILSMPGAQFWSLLWFSMLFCLGIDSMFGTIEGLITPIYDLGASKKIKHLHMIGIVIFASALISLTFVQGSGVYWLDVFDTYAGGLPLLIVAFAELAAIGWCYGYRRFVYIKVELWNYGYKFGKLYSSHEESVVAMIGPRDNWFRKALSYYWRLMIPVISPLALFAVFVGYLYEKFSSENTYDAWKEDLGKNIKEPYPAGAVAVSVLLAVCCTIWIPLVAAYHAYRQYKNPQPEDGQQAVARYNISHDNNGGINVASHDNPAFNGFAPEDSQEKEKQEV